MTLADALNNANPQAVAHAIARQATETLGPAGASAFADQIVKAQQDCARKESE